MNTPFSHILTGQNTTITGIRGAATAALAAEAAETAPLCIIMPDEEQTIALTRDLQLFVRENFQILHFPAQQIPPYTPLSPDRGIMANRLATLYQIKQMEQGIIVTSAAALQKLLMPISALQSAAEYLEAGEDFDQEELINRLISMGYEKRALVQKPGDFSLRGGIIDIYPPPFYDDSTLLHTSPLRLDFFGDTIESLRHFDPINQRSTGEIVAATLLPISEILLKKDNNKHDKLAEIFAENSEKFHWNSNETHRLVEFARQGMRFAGMEFFLPFYYSDDKLGSFLDHLLPNCQIMLYDPPAISESISLGWERIVANYHSTQADITITAEDSNRNKKSLNSTPALPPEHLFLSPEELDKKISQFTLLRISDFPQTDEKQLNAGCIDHRLPAQEISLRRTKTGLITPLAEQIHQWVKEDGTVILCCRSSRYVKNLSEMLIQHQLCPKQTSTPLSLTEFAKKKGFYICNHPLSKGFSVSAASLHIVSEKELFGEMRLGNRRCRREKENEPIQFSELNSGDIVVHRDYGLGLYLGLRSIEVQGIINDFVLLEYREGDKLYLPVDRLNCISRYQGLSDKTPRLDKLGSQAWRTTTNKIKEEVWKVAYELLDIYAKRELKEGRQFSSPGALYKELEESFPYEETPGQMAAIVDVLDDLTSDKPMDRLVCGDVGYGKTEVAVRTAFKVVEDGYQVAILVPTTVLAEQHAKTFNERLAGFPVSIGCLNRFRSRSAQKEILQKLKEGKIDIVIGTHRLLSKDIQFNKLGLVIIDEEHRFGVAHKEKLKKMRAEVDILTLTATPIPRTLQMSLLSIRDLSVISTPPAHRRPVKTYVANFDELLIKEAISKELRRGGQVFFIHNRVRSIHQTAAQIQKLVPDAKIAVAHGQMDGKQLEKIMVAFVAGEVNVLVATTIVESGLDISAANTMIINRADMLGLAEIYQLRGRVGRSAIQAFAYLLVPSLDHLSKDAKERLRALIDTNELGGGFKLAMSDLQIRGGGNLLGISQSGNIAAIGYDLYLDLLQKTVADLKAKELAGTTLRDEIDPEVQLQLSAYIPERYIPDTSQRYITYRHIAALASQDDVLWQEYREELRDRYGSLPEETDTLLRIIALKKRLANLRISKLEQAPDNLSFTFMEDTPLTPAMLISFLEKHPGSKKHKPTKITPDGRIVYYCDLKSREIIFAAASGALDEFKELITN